ncbi:MAG: Gfo/Idh/MocA family oxidoreductase [Clostridia bacterium]|nr:Gfo/Idh/MocA family oxidoreductase [Clostridia bacterium]
MKKFKIGIFGAGRGADIAKNLMLLEDCEIVALCDFNERRAKEGLEKLGKDIPLFKDFNEFIEQELDAVVIANYFHEHTPYAIKCFEKNIHVFCECISNSTLAEGVELIRAYEKSESIYMLAENYPQMSFNREMKRVCDSGVLGKILYAEGEYNHPLSPNDPDFAKNYCYFVEHWRHFLPRSYYITHSLSPLMWSTGATPKRVSAAAVFEPFKEKATARYVGDRAAVITTVNDDGSIFKVAGCAAFGAHHNSYRICGTEGQIENPRGMGEKVMLRFNEWSIPQGKEEVNLYDATFDDKDEELIKKSGHGGGDYIVARMFIDCLKEHKEPELPYDIYSAINMSSVAILAHRSILENGTPYDIPDFRKEEMRKKYENDRHSPFYYTDGTKPDIPCCTKVDYKPSKEQLDAYMEEMKKW